MSSRTLLNIGLLFLVVVLAAFIFLEPGKEQEPEPTLLTQLKAEDIHHIQLIRPNEEDIILEKSQAIWFMRSPYALPANDYRLQSLLQLSQAQSHSQHRLKSSERAKFELDKPKASIVFNHDLRIDFGSKAPLSQQRYIAIDNTLHLIADTSYYHLLSEVTQYLSHALFPANTEFTELALPDLKISLHDGQWQLSPQQENKSADAITDLLNEWRHAQALSLKPIEDFPAAIHTIKLSIKDQKQPVEFISYKTDDYFILSSRERGIQYQFPEEKMQALFQLSEPLADDAPADNDMPLPESAN